MKFYVVIVIGLLYSFHSTAQLKKDIRHNELSFQLDNDFFMLDLRDRYYTYGTNIAYRRLLTQESLFYNFLKFKNISKSVISTSLHHEIYNPVNIREDEYDNIDRPYAGLMYLRGNQSVFWENSFFKYGLELGWMGPANQTDDIQTNMHLTFGWVTPRGWDDYQINNSLLLHGLLSYGVEFFSSEFLSLGGASTLKLGSVQSNWKSEGVIRIGKLNAYNSSVYSQSRLGELSEVEVFLYYNPQVKYVFYDATIEGNIWGEESVFTKQVENWVFLQRIGLMYGAELIDIKFSLTFLSPEVVGGQEHAYGSLALSLKF